jgi:glycosyltransferase involved in cell wall biosynthesis
MLSPFYLKEMNVLHLSQSTTAGAGRAAYRLHRALVSAGLDSYLIANDLEHSDSTVLVSKNRFRKGCNLLKLPERYDKLSIQFSTGKSPALFAANSTPDYLLPRISHVNPDIINMSWISKGFLKIETIGKLDRPLVWTLMDMWPFTGGCFYAQDCNRYTRSCGQCPQLGSNQANDLSRQIWERKAKTLKGLNLTIVAPSTWLADCASKSSLFQSLPIETIPYGLDTTRYQPISQYEARKALNLPQDKQLVLFGAVNATSDPRKGFQLLCPALRRLYDAGAHDGLELVVFGSTAPKQPLDFGFKAHYLGSLSDDIALAMVYSAADIMVVPSLQEAFGQTASEALACGTPVVAFDQTGVAEIVTHQQTGYLATPFEVEDLSQGIAWVLEDNARLINLREQARRRAEQEFSLATQSQRYIELFHQILDRPRPSDLPRPTINIAQ